ncbi:MAG: hypothetical protein OEY33_05755, partial [Bdellovibrionales bacterium]|nr:hypothetical protein [Bdellovibrionales bacterium]
MSLSATSQTKQNQIKFNIGDQIQVLSDKAFRRTKDKSFEAIGNVIITHYDKALYGQRAMVSFETGEVKVVGNVRYIGPEMTVYGTEMSFNFKTQALTIKNARIKGENYTVLGKKIVRKDKKNIIATDAEYSTCLDCPESWSIFGRDIHITLGEYVRIKNAYFKSKGVVFFYFPYIVFPIKKKRETGLLFPSFGIDFEEGLRVKQPWFWAISDYNDLTLSPSFLGDRGLGNEFEFRQMFGEKKWLEFNSVQAFDRIYLPGKYDYEVSGKHYARHFSVLETHNIFGHYLNTHIFINDLRDLDMVRDYSFYTDNYLEGSEILRTAYLDWRTPYSVISTQGFYNKNILVDDSRQFDKSLVQILPKTKLSLLPFVLLDTPYFPLEKILISVEGDYSIFRQAEVKKGEFIRNARRVNLKPEIRWNFGSIGPLSLATKTYLDLQTYHFPNEDQKTFTKKGLVHESEVSFNLFKIFGLAYIQEYTPDKLIKEDQKKNKSDLKNKDLMINSLGEFDPSYSTQKVKVIKNSYRHNQNFNIKHYLVTDQSVRGNQNFSRQIKDERGIFDYIDALRDQDNTFGHLTSKTRLPLRNTLELQWNNSIIKKTPQNVRPMQDRLFLREQFNYSEVAYFNLSQGYQLGREELDLEDRLTRLYIKGGVSAGHYGFNFNEYYFYSDNGHILDLNIFRNFGVFTLGFGANYDSFSSPVNKTFNINSTIKPNDLLEFSLDYHYDWEKKLSSESSYGLIYKPRNNCWMIDAKYIRSRIEKKFSLNFLINFNDNAFTPLTGS